MASNADPVEIDGNAHAPKRDDVSAGRRALRRDQEIIGKGMASRIRSLFALQGGDHPPRCWPGDRSRRRGTSGTSRTGKAGRTGLNAGSLTWASGDLLH